MVEKTQCVRMEDKNLDAKSAEDQVYVSMEGRRSNAKTAEDLLSVSTEE